MNTVNEKDDLFLDLTFTNSDGLGVIPTAIVYRVDDVLSGVEVKGNTLEYPTAATHTIDITSAENSIFNVDVGSEERRVTISMYFLDGDRVERRKNVEYFYTITNLRMLDTPILTMTEGQHGVSNDAIVLVI